MNTQNNLEIFNEGYALLKNEIDQTDSAMHHWKPSPDRWSIAEVIAHMADSEANTYIRFRRMIAEPGSEVLGYNQDAWADNLFYNKSDVNEMLELFGMFRNATVKLLKNFDINSLKENFILHSENGKMMFDDLLKTYADHVTVHVKQIERICETYSRSFS